MAEIQINIPSSGMSFIKDKMQKDIEDLISYIDANCSKKVTVATMENGKLNLKIYGGLDDSQVERIQDNFNWIDGLEFNSDSEIIFSLDI